MLIPRPTASALDQVDARRNPGRGSPPSRRALRGVPFDVECASSLLEVEPQPGPWTNSQPHCLEPLLVRVNPGARDAQSLGHLVGGRESQWPSSLWSSLEQFGHPSCDRFDVVGVEIHGLLVWAGFNGLSVVEGTGEARSTPLDFVDTDPWSWPGLHRRMQVCNWAANAACNWAANAACFVGR